jgi:transposase InsO family protein
MQCPPIIEKPFSRISIDIVGSMPETSKGNRVALTIVDHSTRWVEAYAMPGHKSTDVIRALLDYFARYGIVDEILHDLGTDFTSELTQVVLKFYGVCQLHSSVSHPQTNTAVERFHCTMKSMIRALSYEHGIEWDDALPLLLFAYSPSDIGATIIASAASRPLRLLFAPISSALHYCASRQFMMWIIDRPVE